MWDEKSVRAIMGQIIRRLRVEQALNQREMARRLGCPQATVSAWETGKAFPDGLNIVRLEAGLGLVAGDLLKRLREALPPLMGASDTQLPTGGIMSTRARRALARILADCQGAFEPWRPLALAA